MVVEGLAGGVEVLNGEPLLLLLEISDDEREKLNWEVGERGRTGGRG